MNIRSILTSTRGAIELTQSGIAASAAGLGVVGFAVYIFAQVVGSMH